MTPSPTDFRPAVIVLAPRPPVEAIASHTDLRPAVIVMVPQPVPLVLHVTTLWLPKVTVTQPGADILIERLITANEPIAGLYGHVYEPISG